MEETGVPEDATEIKGTDVRDAEGVAEILLVPVGAGVVLGGGVKPPYVQTPSVPRLTW